jgi:hypothetical protein
MKGDYIINADFPHIRCFNISHVKLILSRNIMPLIRQKTIISSGNNIFNIAKFSNLKEYLKQTGLVASENSGIKSYEM